VGSPAKKIQPKAKSDRRKSRRTQTKSRAYIHVGEDVYIAPTDTLSSSGIFVQGLTKIAQGTQVRVVIESQLIKFPIRVLGTVVRVDNKADKKGGIAIQFTALPEETRTEIEDFVRTMNEINQTKSG